MTTKKVTLYSKTGCTACQKVKEFLSQNQIAFVNRDIMADELARSDLQQLGYMTTPVTMIDATLSWALIPQDWKRCWGLGLIHAKAGFRNISSKNGRSLRLPNKGIRWHPRFA